MPELMPSAVKPLSLLEYSLRKTYDMHDEKSRPPFSQYMADSLRQEIEGYKHIFSTGAYKDADNISDKLERIEYEIAHIAIRIDAWSYIIPGIVHEGKPPKPDPNLENCRMSLYDYRAYKRELEKLRRDLLINANQGSDKGKSASNVEEPPQGKSNLFKTEIRLLFKVLYEVEPTIFRGKGEGEAAEQLQPILRVSNTPDNFRRLGETSAFKPNHKDKVRDLLLRALKSGLLS